MLSPPSLASTSRLVLVAGGGILRDDVLHRGLLGALVLPQPRGSVRVAGGPGLHELPALGVAVLVVERLVLIGRRCLPAVAFHSVATGLRGGVLDGVLSALGGDDVGAVLLDGVGGVDGAVLLLDHIRPLLIGGLLRGQGDDPRDGVRRGHHPEAEEAERHEHDEGHHGTERRPLPLVPIAQRHYSRSLSIISSIVQIKGNVSKIELPRVVP